MVNYGNGKIYIIRSGSTDDVYIGSTIQPLSKRLGGHRSKYKCYLAGKTHNYTSFKLIALGDYYIELLEHFPCNSKEELLAREGHFIRTTKHCINRCIAGRTKKEYRHDNKEQINEREKQYYQNNKERIAKRKKQYRQNNKDKIDKHKNQKYSCICGGKYTHRNKSQHFKTNKHNKFIQLHLREIRGWRFL